MVRLSQRMQALADMVTPGHTLCDVGCDHGFLPIYLVQTKQISRAVAMDVATGPLSTAQKHIAEAGLSQQIITRLSDGLQKLQPDETDTILIAGMGGGLILHILSQSQKVAKSAKELILQPQSEVYQVRAYLFSEGYELLEENMVLEDGKFYPMMKVRYFQKPNAKEKPSELELYFGKKLLEEKNTVLKEYLLREKRIQKQVWEQLNSRQLTEPIAKRMQEVNEYLTFVETALEDFA